MPAKWTVFLLALAVLTPMYGTLFGHFHANVALYGVYFSGLTFFLFANFKQMLFSKLDALVLLFNLFFIASLAYTVNQDFKTEMILFAILPLFYFNGKLLIYTNSHTLFFRFVVLIIFAVNVYVFLKLNENGFNYNKYYRYSTSWLLLDYLTLALFDLLAAIILYTTNVIANKYIKSGIIMLFLFMILISGARYSILFLGLSLFIFFMLLPAAKKLSTVVIGGSALTLILLGSSKIQDLFAYTIFRMSNISGGHDASLDGRENVLNLSLALIDKNPIFGYGLNSSEALLYPIPFPHNMLIEAFLETGLLNTVILATIVGSVLIMGLRLFWRNKNYFSGIFIIDLYLIMSHLKSFSIAEGKILFFFFGITMGFYSVYFKKLHYPDEEPQK